MKLNIIILLLFVVVSQAQRPKLHNVIAQSAPAPVADQFTRDIAVLPSQLIVEKTGEPWTPTKETIYASESVDGNFNHCGRREGWVVLAHPENLEYSDNGAATSALHGQQVFVELDAKTITFFKNHNFNSVIATHQLKDLAPPVVVQDWKQFNCFQLELHNSDLVKVSGSLPPLGRTWHPSTTAVASICTGDEKEMDHWMKDIQIFPRCQLLQPPNPNPNPPPKGSQLIMDITHSYNSSSYTETQASWEEYQRIQNEMSRSIHKLQLDYSNKQEYERKHELEQEAQIRIDQVNEESKEEEFTITKKSEEMIDVLNTAMKKQSEVRREQTEEQMELDEEAQRLKDEKECLEKLLEKRREAESDEEKSEIQNEEIAAENNLLEQSKAEMLKDAQVKFSAETAANELAKKQKEADINGIKTGMVDIVYQANANVYDQKYCENNGSDQEQFLTNLCNNLAQVKNVDAAQQSNCTQPDKFCSYCCSVFIGSENEAPLRECRDGCASKMVVPAVADGAQRRRKFL